MYEPSSSNTILLFCSQTLPTAPRAVVTLRGPLSPHLPLDLSRIGMSPRRRRHEGTPPSPGELKNAACRPICHLTCQESGHRHGGGDRQARLVKNRDIATVEETGRHPNKPGEPKTLLSHISCAVSAETFTASHKSLEPWEIPRAKAH